jgi:hypothetical protein
LAVAADAYSFHAEVWLHPGEAGWHFVTLPADVADEIRERMMGSARPFRSTPVHVTIGRTAWTTSLFADTKIASYLLPIKAGIRRSERLAAGDEVRVTIDLLAP